MHLSKKQLWIIPERPFLSVGGEVWFAHEEQIHGLWELMKACVQQIKLVVDVDGVDHPPRGFSGRQPLLSWQIGVVHHCGNPAVRSVPPRPTNALDQPLPVALGPSFDLWHNGGLLLELQRFPLPGSNCPTNCSVSRRPPWFSIVLFRSSYLCPLPEAKGSSFGAHKVRGFVILKLESASMEVSHGFYGIPEMMLFSCWFLWRV